MHCDRLVIPDNTFPPRLLAMCVSCWRNALEFEISGSICLSFCISFTHVYACSWTYNFSTIITQNAVDALCVAFSNIPLALRLHLACLDSTIGISGTGNLESFPLLRAVSFSLHKRFGGSSWEAINKMIVAAKNIESLELHHTTQKFAPIAGPLPPILSLSLSQCRWLYTGDELLKIWNFSRRQHLSLVKLNTTELIALLDSFPAKDASGLRTLEIALKKFPITNPDVLIQPLKRLLQHGTKLETLDIPCDIHNFEVAALSKCIRLRVLKFRGISQLSAKPLVNVFDSNSGQLSTKKDLDCLSILVQKLELLHKSSPLIQELDVSFGRESFQVINFNKPLQILVI